MVNTAPYGIWDIQHILLTFHLYVIRQMQHTDDDLRLTTSCVSQLCDYTETSSEQKMMQASTWAFALWDADTNGTWQAPQACGEKKALGREPWATFKFARIPTQASTLKTSLLLALLATKRLRAA